MGWGTETLLYPLAIRPLICVERLVLSLNVLVNHRVRMPTGGTAVGYLKSHDAITEHEAVHNGACLPRAPEEWRDCTSETTCGWRNILAGFSVGRSEFGFGDAALEGQ